MHNLNCGKSSPKLWGTSAIFKKRKYRHGDNISDEDTSNKDISDEDTSNKDISNKDISKTNISNEDLSNIPIYRMMISRIYRHLEFVRTLI
jgi:uncharacterized protein YjbI with pentapeptide repeats